MAETKIFVSTRDRADCTRDCVDSLICTTKGQADIWLFDNGSKLESEYLNLLYLNWLKRGEVQQVIMNRPAQIPGMYWSKNYAWSQFITLTAALPEPERRYLIMVDNDTIAEEGWLRASLAILNDKEAQKFGVKVVSPYDGPPDPTTNPDIYKILSTETVAGHGVQIRDALSSRFWVARDNFWRQWEPPTWKQIERLGKPDRMPTDWYYWTRMRETKQRFAVMVPPLCHDPKDPWKSARMSNGIGGDCR